MMRLVRRLRLNHTFWVPTVLVALMGVAGWADTSCTRVPADPNSLWATPQPSARWQPTNGTQAAFGDGTYRVGVDIPAGTYQADVPSGSPGCRWERRRSPNPESVIAHGNTAPGSITTVTVDFTDKVFVAAGCGTWTRIR
jgi:hypothetical protein